MGLCLYMSTDFNAIQLILLFEKGCLESSLEPVVGMLKTLLHVNKKSHLRVDYQLQKVHKINSQFPLQTEK